MVTSLLSGLLLGHEPDRLSLKVLGVERRRFEDAYIESGEIGERFAGFNSMFGTQWSQVYYPVGVFERRYVINFYSEGAASLSFQTFREGRVKVVWELELKKGEGNNERQGTLWRILHENDAVLREPEALTKAQRVSLNAVKGFAGYMLHDPEAWDFLAGYIREDGVARTGDLYERLEKGWLPITAEEAGVLGFERKRWTGMEGVKVGEMRFKYMAPRPADWLW